MPKKVLKFCLISLLFFACTPNIRYNVDPQKLGAVKTNKTSDDKSMPSTSNPLYVTKSDKYHIVQRGDNLTQISKARGISVKKLKLYNNLVDDNIFLGQKIYFEPNMAVFPKYITRVNIPAEKYHIVGYGQTLADISHMYGIFILDLVKFNGLSNTDIKQGQKIWLVDGKSEPKTSLSQKKVVVSTPKRKSVKVAPKVSKISRTVKAPKLATGGKVILAKKPAVSSVKTVERASTKTVLQATPQHSGLRMPTDGGRIISNFGKHGFTINKGINIAGEEGQVVNAVLPGKVIFAGEQRGYGNVIVLEHENFVMTVYAHNQANLVRSGDKVVAGQPIAKLGKSGRVESPQLHFEYRVKGKAVDPRKVLTQK